MKELKIGSRKSDLAMVQSRYVQSELEKANPNLKLTITEIATVGDKILDVALNKIGEKSLFTKELEIALANKEVDFVVHSLKDLPTQLPPGMKLAAILEREDPRDAVVMSTKNKGKKIEDLPPGSVIGTSSVRRISQLKRKFPTLKFMDVRGNLNTRLCKLDDSEGPYEAVILAAAGMKRLGWVDRISQFLNADKEGIYHAVSQGALGIECREEDNDVINLLGCLIHRPTNLCCLAERAMLRKLEGGCSVPIGVHTNWSDKNLSMTGVVCSLDGNEYVEVSIIKEINDDNKAEALGTEVAEELIKKGADKILEVILKN